MISNYLKIAWRNLTRNKVFSFINIFGLALSMAVCLLVIIHVKDQLSYDNFHPRANRMARIISQVTGREGNSLTWASTPLPLGDKLTSNYDLVETITRIYPCNGNGSNGVKDLRLRQAFVDNSFFSLFGFTLEAGNPSTALTAPNSIVLSHRTAEKFFSQGGHAIGQTINIANLGDFVVTGVMKEPAGKSHLLQDAYLSISTVPQLEKAGKLSAALQQWDLTKDILTSP